MKEIYERTWGWRFPKNGIVRAIEKHIYIEIKYTYYVFSRITNMYILGVRI